MKLHFLILRHTRLFMTCSVKGWLINCKRFQKRETCGGVVILCGGFTGETGLHLANEPRWVWHPWSRMCMMSYLSSMSRYKQTIFVKEEKRNHTALFTHTLRLRSLWRSCSESLKVKENVFLLLNSIRERGGGFTHGALGSSMTESPLLRLSAAVTHFNSTLFLPHWKPSTMTFNKGRRVKTWLFLHILSPPDSAGARAKELITAL